MTVHKVGECEVEIGKDYVVTRFPDGKELHAHPNFSEEDIARAYALGYGDPDCDCRFHDDRAAVVGMTLDHDYYHSLLAEARGLPYSPALYAAAGGDPITHQEGDDEERIVFLLQRLSNETDEEL